MPVVFRISLAACTWAALFYAAALILAVLAFPLREDAPTVAHSTEHAGQSIYRTQPKFIVLNRAPLMAEGGPRVLLTGASNMLVGFKADPLQAALGIPVHHFALGGANLTEVRQVVDLALEALPAEALLDLTVVVGVWYGLFVDDAARWKGKPTDIDVERFRYGLYRRQSDAVVPRLPAGWLPFASLALRPLLALDVAVKGTLAPYRHSIERGPPPADLDEVRLDEAFKERAMRHWNGETGPPAFLPSEQFERLEEMVQDLAARGVRVIVLDLPIPAWHMARSHHFAGYQLQKLPYFDAMRALPGVRVVDWQADAAEDDFYDEVHPKPRTAIRWSALLAGLLRPAPSEPAIVSAR